jgi:hypothetical protein
VYDETIYNSYARARFAGCTYFRHIILVLNTVLADHLLIERITNNLAELPHYVLQNETDSFFVV